MARAAAAGAADPDMPSEFPERWSRFLPPEDVTARLRTHARTHVKSTHAKSTHAKNSEANGEAPPPSEQ